MARLLFAYPDKAAKVRSDEGVPAHVAKPWADLIERIYGRAMRRDDDNSPVPYSVWFTAEARAAFNHWVDHHDREVGADDFPAVFDGAWGKLEAYAARLALILHLLDLADAGTLPPDGDLPDLPGPTLDRALRLVAYFKAHARKAYAAMGGNPADGGDDVRALLGWVLKGDHRDFSTRDVARNFTRFKGDPESLTRTLDWLPRRGIVRLNRPVQSPGRRGRIPLPRYDVNPDLWTSPQFHRLRQHYVGESTGQFVVFGNSTVHPGRAS